MTDLVQCPRCEGAFLMLPGTCPACHEHIELTAAAAAARAAVARDRVVSSRLNRTASLGGVMISGLLTGALSWFLVSPQMGGVLLLLAVIVSGVILWRR